MKSRAKILNRIEYMLSLSEWKDNFVVTNVSFKCSSYPDTFYDHFGEWWENNDDDNYFIICNTLHKKDLLINISKVPEHRVMLRKEFTSARKNYRKELEETLYNSWRGGKLILIDISDVRLLNAIKFKFALCKNNVKQLSRVHIYYKTGHRTIETFDRVRYYSDEDNNKYLHKRKRLENIEEILEDELQ